MKAYLETEEIEKLQNAAKYLRDKVLVRLLSRLGWRVSEALARMKNRGICQILRKRLKTLMPEFNTAFLM